MMATGRQTVADVKVAERLSVNRIATGALYVTALRTNTDYVAVGPREVDAASGRELGVLLAPGQSLQLESVSPDDLWISVRVANEGVLWWTTL